MIDDKQVNELVTLVALTQRPAFVGIFLFVNEVVNRVDDGDAAFRLRLFKH